MNVGFGWWHLPVLVDWGNVPGYFAGLAFTLAAWTYRTSVKANIAEQAGRISFWVDWNGQPPPGGHWQVWVKNSSETPVSAVAVDVVQESSLRKGPRKDTWLGEPEGTKFAYQAEYRFLGPGAERLIYESKGAPVTAVCLSFNDSAGKTWKQSMKDGRYAKPEQVK